jgi:hypothetical protein
MTVSEPSRGIPPSRVIRSSFTHGAPLGVPHRDEDPDRDFNAGFVYPPILDAHDRLFPPRADVNVSPTAGTASNDGHCRSTSSS